MRRKKYTIVYWATLLDNVIKGYDPETGHFDKERVPSAKFRDRCYFVTRKDLALGIAKAEKIAQKVTGNANKVPPICVLKTRLPSNELTPNKNGFGLLRIGNSFPVSAIFIFENGHLQSLAPKDLAPVSKKEVPHEY